jgi:hypothetical protein
MNMSKGNRIIRSANVFIFHNYMFEQEGAGVEEVVVTMKMPFASVGSGTLEP